jgi:Tfp pilus assembly protein PilN
MPNNVWLTSMQVGEGTATASGTPAAPATLTPTAAAPAAPVPIGSITFAGVAFKHDDVAAWLDAMAKVKSFSDPTFTSSTEAVLGGHNVVDFGGSVTLLSTALSNRYTAPASPATTPGAVTP